MEDYRARMISADTVAGSLESAWARFAEALPETRFRHHSPGVVAIVTGLPIPSMNGVWVSGEDVSAAHVEELLDQVSGSSLPFCLQGRPAARDRLAAAAARFGMTFDEDVPLMVLDDHSDLTAAQHDPHLRFRTGGRDLLAEHADVAAAGFEAPVDIFQAMAELLELGPTPNVVLGDVAGSPVTTALSVEADPGSAGIFNVATPPAHRGHGYGAAATAQAVAASSAQGATWAWLQSSSDGHGIYQRLGFRDVELWPCWVSADS